MADQWTKSKANSKALIGPGIATVAADGAKTGWEAMKKGEPAAVHGIKNRLEVAAADIMTDARTAKLHRAQMEPRSAPK